MAYDIGPRIGIDGESEFRKQLNNINTSLKTLGTEMQKVTSEFAENANSEQALIAKNNVLNKSIDQQKQKIKQVQTALDAAEKKYGENSNEALRWQQVLNRSQTSLNKLETELKQNNRALQNMGKELNDTESDLKSFDSASEKAGKAGSGFGQSLLAGITGGGIVSAIQGIGSSIANLVSETQEYRKIMGSLEISSTSAGYSAEETAQTYKQLYGVLADDQTAATTTSNLQALGLSQQQLTQITNGAVGAWAKYGDSIPIDGLAEAINETAKTGTVTGNFADVLNWAGKSEDEFNKKLQAAGSESERANLILQELTDQGLIQAGEAWQENNKSLVENNQASADLQNTMGTIGEIIEPVVTKVKEGFNGILTSFLSLGTAFQEGGTEGFMNAGMNMIQSLISGITTQVPALWNNAVTMFSQYIESLRTMLPQIISFGTSMINDLVTGILNGLPGFIAQAGEMIRQFLDTILSTLPQMISAGGDMLLNFIQGIANNLPNLISQAFSMIMDFIATILKNLPKIIQTGIELIGKLLAGIIQAIPKLIGAIPGIISNIKDKFLSIDWGEIGLNIINGIKDGIINAAKALVDAIKNVASSILGGIKSFLGIKSPSRVFRDQVGKYIAEGIGVGFTDEMKYVSKDMQKSLSKTIPQLDGIYSMSSTPAYSGIDYERLERMQGKGIYLNGRLVGRELRDMGVVFG